MDTKDRRHRSLTRSRCGKDLHYTSSSLDSEDCRVPTQKSYSSSETLKAYDHDSRLHYGGCVADLVHHEADEYSRQAGNFRLAELGVCEPAPHQSAYCSDLGLLHRGYSLSAGSDADSDPEGAMSPERAIQLWGGHGVKSRRSSGLSSRENSALTLTDSDNDNKSDEESAHDLACLALICPAALPLLPPHRHHLLSRLLSGVRSLGQFPRAPPLSLPGANERLQGVNVQRPFPLVRPRPSARCQSWICVRDV